MAVAYLDTSWLLGIAFGEPGARRLAGTLGRYQRVVSANLLDAEFRSAHRREGVSPDERLLARVSWILPERPLGEEVARVLEQGHARGADCWHLAVALYFAGDPALVAFLSLDQGQRGIAQALGFHLPDKE